MHQQSQIVASDTHQHPSGASLAQCEPATREHSEAPEGSSLDQRTNFDGGGISGTIKARMTLRLYGEGLAECTLTRARMPRRRQQEGDPVQEVEERREASPIERVQRLKKSAGRSKTSLRRAVLAGDLDHMVTLTFRRNETDQRTAWNCAVRWTRAMRDALGAFSYVIVAERQKRGAWHFHCAVRGKQDVGLIREAWARSGGCGNIDVKYFRKSRPVMARYLSKYIAKSFGEELCGEEVCHRYRRSQDLRPEVVTEIKTIDPREAREEIRRLFESQGLYGYAEAPAKHHADIEYYVWGCTWDREGNPNAPPTDPLRASGVARDATSGAWYDVETGEVRG